MPKCIECKINVVHYYRSIFCEECLRDFFDEGDREDGQLIDKN